ncbi:MAG: hypothetical protein Q8M31_07650 [Beijerinckiaceae bacterium]|nr:hypothetical protein [Beijerinckiaceae bacterium]
MNTLRKTLTAAVAALAVSSGALAAVGSAEAGQRYVRSHSYHGGTSAGPVIAGVIGGLALGALAASSSRRSYAYDSGYGYAPAPVYRGGYAQSGYGYGYREVYGAQCFIQKQAVYDNWGNYAGSRKVRVCQ